MAAQPDRSFSDLLREALAISELSQAALASALGIDAGQVSRWVNGKAGAPRDERIREIEQILGVNIIDSLSKSELKNHVYISAPIVGLDENSLASHVRKIESVVQSVARMTSSYYWPGSEIESMSQLLAADIATEQNLRVLGDSDAFLYLQFDEVIRPTSALVELGIALGRKIKTTIIVGTGLRQPYMFDGFVGVAANLRFLPHVHLYTVKSPAEAIRLIERNSTALFGPP